MSEWYNDCLENHIKSSKFSSISSLALIAKQVLSALSVLEEKGITHRALASHNILVTPEVTMRMCVCVCVCVCMKGVGREKEKKQEKYVEEGRIERRERVGGGVGEVCVK